MKIKDNENVKINNYNNKKENVKIIIITIMKSIITIMIRDIENQIETVNRNKDTKIKGISITINIMILIITMIGILFA
ncbi:hypothetical protein [Pseudoruminococcus massiliensis]|uniref:hypothetical protein n=1 Tax=Pseudoruminococcus massiliensis TaxID=2086583 RepID=UPI003FD8428E